MMIGGLRLPGLNDRSRLGDESRDEGLEDSERGEMGPGWRPLGESSVVMMRDRAETGRLGNLSSAGNPLPVWRLQLVTEAPRACCVLRG